MIGAPIAATEDGSAGDSAGTPRLPRRMPRGWLLIRFSMFFDRMLGRPASFQNRCCAYSFRSLCAEMILLNELSFRWWIYSNLLAGILTKRGIHLWNWAETWGLREIGARMVEMRWGRVSEGGLAMSTRRSFICQNRRCNWRKWFFCVLMIAD